MMRIASFPSLLVALALLQIGAQRGFPQTYTNGDWIYTLDAFNEATITAYRGADGVIDIPGVVGGHPVTSIGAWAFALMGITGVTIPDSVSVIGESAFLGCPYLRSVTIPVNITNIGAGAFYDTRGLTNFTVPSGNTHYSALDGVLFDKSREELVQFPVGRGGVYTIPDGVVRVGALAFAASLDPGLTAVSIPDTVTILDGGAFQNNASLTNIHFGANISVIGNGAFVNCGGLTNVVLPHHLTVLGNNAFAGCTGVTKLSLPESTLVIGDGAFARTAMGDVTIPPGVTNIGAAAFQYCTNLTTINVDHSSSTYTSLDGVLFDKEQGALIQFPGGRPGAYTVPDGTTSLTTGSFQGAGRLSSVSIPHTVQAIGDAAFYDCHNLTNIRIALGVTTIGFDSFSGCDSLESIVLPHTLTSIGALAFDRCTSLRSLLFLGNAPYIAPHPFYPDLESLGDAPISAVNFLYGSSGWASLFGTHPTVMTTVFTESQYARNRANGQIDVTTDPAAFKLFTQSQRNAYGALQYGSGQSSVTSNPAAFELFTQSQRNAYGALQFGGGQSSVTSNPAAFELFTQSQRDAYGALQFGSGQTSVTSNPDSFGLYTANQYNANRSSGVQSVLGSMPSVDLSVSSSVVIRAGLGTTNITAVTASHLPPGWQYDSSKQEIYGRLQGGNPASALLLGLRPTGETIPIALNFTPVASEITAISIPLSRKIKANKTVKLPIIVWNNFASSKNVTVEFSSSDESKLAAPATISITVPGRNSSSGKPGRVAIMPTLRAGNSAGEVELIASVGGVNSAPCSVTIKASKRR